MAMDVGHGYDVPQPHQRVTTSSGIAKTEGMLFDCVDLCVNEALTTCILGANGSGKSTLLHLLAKMEQPLEGSVHHAHNVSVGYFDQHVVDDTLEAGNTKGKLCSDTAVSSNGALSVQD